MINFDGNIQQASPDFLNRGFLFGDGVFETLKVYQGRVLFLEDHYFRLMSAMRIVRMEIPMSFTMEYIEMQILNLTRSLSFDSARVRITVFRKTGGFYAPQTNEVSFVVSATALENDRYILEETRYEIDLFKDYVVTAQLLSTIKSTNRILNITAAVYAAENGLDNCLLLNEQKNVVEAIQGNIFMFTENKLVTPSLSDGCLNGIMRKQILAIARKMPDIEVVESSISPFELQKADELFITNVIWGIRRVTKYRKKEYAGNLSAALTERLNASVISST